ncbi:MAG: glycosyltransferase [Sphingobacteriales bacterium JAD_PAG50586_3]|nr:MAG: glycosyltransferase [Sphingobacteriales bacterium JAD_PAG50586_3]
MQPLISVILPAYNAGPYIAEAIQSILDQTFYDFELIIVNDCSTDNTEEQILAIPDTRIQYIKNAQNSGLIYNLNLGFSLAKGKYIVRMDADDISLPTRIAEQVAFMEANPEIGISGTWFQSFGKNNKLGKYEEDDVQIKLQMLYHCRFCHPTVIIRKQIVDSHKLQYSATFAHAEDYELWARMAFITRFANIPKVLLKYRIHLDNVTVKHATTQRQNSDKVIEYLFNKIGTTISPDTIPAWIKFCYAEFNLSVSQITQLEQLMVNLIKANQASKYVTPVAPNNS